MHGRAFFRLRLECRVGPLNPRPGLRLLLVIRQPQEIPDYSISVRFRTIPKTKRCSRVTFDLDAGTIAWLDLRPAIVRHRPDLEFARLPLGCNDVTHLGTVCHAHRFPRAESDCCPVNFKLHHFPEIPEMFFLDSEPPVCKMKNIYSSK